MGRKKIHTYYFNGIERVMYKERMPLTDKLFTAILDNYKKEFLNILADYRKGNSRSSILFNEETASALSTLPFSSFFSYRLTISQFKKILDFCFDISEYDPETESRKLYEAYIEKYHLALNIFLVCIAPKGVMLPETTISKKVEKCYRLYLDKLVEYKVYGALVLKERLIHIGMSGIGKIGAEYLNKFDFYKIDEQMVTACLFGKYESVTGLNYRGYNNARMYNDAIMASSDKQFLDDIDAERFKIEDNFPYTEEEEETKDNED